MYVCICVHVCMCVCMYVCMYVQWRHSNPALNAWSSGHNTRPHARLPPSFLGTDAWITSQH